jgi:hypothetical protein
MKRPGHRHAAFQQTAKGEANPRIHFCSTGATHHNDMRLDNDSGQRGDGQHAEIKRSEGFITDFDASVRAGDKIQHARFQRLHRVHHSEATDLPEQDRKHQQVSPMRRIP